LFAALNIATGNVTARCLPRHRHQEFLRFLKQVARAYPSRELHLVMDNYAAHKRIEVRERLAANPRVRAHLTPTSASWLNLVEAWFGIIEAQGHSPRQLRQRRRPHPPHPRLYRRLERPRPPSSGPRQPTRSSPKQTGKRLQTRATSRSGGEGFADELVDDVAEPDLPAVRGHVDLEVQRHT
jgi:transposase